MCCLYVKNVRTSVCTCLYVYVRACVYAYMCVFCGMYVCDINITASHRDAALFRDLSGNHIHGSV